MAQEPTSNAAAGDAVRLPADDPSQRVMNATAATLPVLEETGSLAEQAVALIQREEGALRWVIARYVRDAATVDDIFQEVSLKVLKRLDTVRDPAALRGWLFQLARNACLDWLRREDRRQATAGEGVLADHAAKGELGRGPCDVILSRERIAAVRRALEALPPAQREALRLRIDDGLDHEAIAARLGISRQAVEVRLCRGRATLKDQLEDIFGGEL